MLLEKGWSYVEISALLSKQLGTLFLRSRHIIIVFITDLQIIVLINIAVILVAVETVVAAIFSSLVLCAPVLKPDFDLKHG